VNVWRLFFKILLLFIDRSRHTQNQHTDFARTEENLYRNTRTRYIHDYYTVCTHAYIPILYVSTCKSNSAERKNHLPRAAWRRRTTPSEIINYIISGHVKNRTDPRTCETCYTRGIHIYRYTFSVWYNNMRLFWS